MLDEAPEFAIVFAFCTPFSYVILGCWIVKHTMHSDDLENTVESTIASWRGETVQSASTLQAYIINFRAWGVRAALYGKIASSETPARNSCEEQRRGHSDWANARLLMT